MPGPYDAGPEMFDEMSDAVDRLQRKLQQLASQRISVRSDDFLGQALRQADTLANKLDGIQRKAGSRLGGYGPDSGPNYAGEPGYTAFAGRQGLPPEPPINPRTGQASGPQSRAYADYQRDLARYQHLAALRAGAMGPFGPPAPNVAARGTYVPTIAPLERQAQADAAYRARRGTAEDYSQSQDLGAQLRQKHDAAQVAVQKRTDELARRAADREQAEADLQQNQQDLADAVARKAHKNVINRFKSKVAQANKDLGGARDREDAAHDALADAQDRQRQARLAVYAHDREVARAPGGLSAKVHGLLRTVPFPGSRTLNGLLSLADLAPEAAMGVTGAGILAGGLAKNYDIQQGVLRQGVPLAAGFGTSVGNADYTGQARAAYLTSGAAAYQYSISEQTAAAIAAGLSRNGVNTPVAGGSQAYDDATKLVKLFGMSVDDATKFVARGMQQLGLSADQVSQQIGSMGAAAAASGQSPSSIAQMVAQNPNFATMTPPGMLGATLATFRSQFGQNPGAIGAVAPFVTNTDAVSTAMLAGYIKMSHPEVTPQSVGDMQRQGRFNELGAMVSDTYRMDEKRQRGLGATHLERAAGVNLAGDYAAQQAIANAPGVPQTQQMVKAEQASENRVRDRLAQIRQTDATLAAAIAGAPLQGAQGLGDLAQGLGTAAAGFTPPWQLGSLTDDQLRAYSSLPLVGGYYAGELANRASGVGRGAGATAMHGVGYRLSGLGRGAQNQLTFDDQIAGIADQLSAPETQTLLSKGEVTHTVHVAGQADVTVRLVDRNGVVSAQTIAVPLSTGDQQAAAYGAPGQPSGVSAATQATPTPQAAPGR